MDWTLEFDQSGQVATGRACGVCHIAEILPEVLATLLAGPSDDGALPPAGPPRSAAHCPGVLVDA